EPPETILARYAADAIANAVFQHHHEHDRQPAGLLRRLRAHRRRAEQLDAVLRLLPVQPRVRLLQHGLRQRDGVAAVPDRADTYPVSDAPRSKVGPLWVRP